MNFGDEVWLVYDNYRECIAENSEASLPLIFDNENDALDCADCSRYWEVKKMHIGII